MKSLYLSIVEWWAGYNIALIERQRQAIDKASLHYSRMLANARCALRDAMKDRPA